MKSKVRFLGETEAQRGVISAPKSHRSPGPWGCLEIPLHSAVSEGGEAGGAEVGTRARPRGQV